MGKESLIARFIGPTWGPSGADRTQVGPMLAHIIWMSNMNQNVSGFIHSIYNLRDDTVPFQLCVNFPDWHYNNLTIQIHLMPCLPDIIVVTSYDTNHRTLHYFVRHGVKCLSSAAILFKKLGYFNRKAFLSIELTKTGANDPKAASRYLYWFKSLLDGTR